MHRFNFNLITAFNLSTMKQILLTTISSIIVCYFCWHALYGAMGFFNYMRIKQELEQQTLKLEYLKLERAQLQNKSKLLHPNSTDKDLIDEIARQSLGLISSSERVIIIDDKDAPK